LDNEAETYHSFI